MLLPQGEENISDRAPICEISAEKISEKDGMQMSLEDFKEDARQKKSASRKEKEKRD